MTDQCAKWLHEQGCAKVRERAYRTLRPHLLQYRQRSSAINKEKINRCQSFDDTPKMEGAAFHEGDFGPGCPNSPSGFSKRVELAGAK